MKPDWKVREVVIDVTGPRDGEHGWRAVWHGELLAPCFNSIGAAEAYLDMIERGQRRPERIIP